MARIDCVGRYCSHQCLFAAGNERRRPIEDRFWEKVKITDDCWLWLASVDSMGYGIIKSPGKQGTMLKAHRVAWTFKHGPIPEGFEVCHKCDVRNCVRDDHLFLGTHKENMYDAWNKGRWSPEIMQQARGI